jgi:HlyD family secretion protein
MTWLGDAVAWLGRLAAAALMALGAALGLGGAPMAPSFQGYVEGEFLLLAASAAGTLDRLDVRRGDWVEAGAPLFALDLTMANAQRAQAAANLAQAQATLEDLTKGRRPDEIDVIAAQRVQAEAALRLSEATLRRQEALAVNQVASRERLDEAQAAVRRDRARLTELAAQLRVGQLPARADTIHAAEAAVAAAAAGLAQAERRLAELAPAAPVAAWVNDTLYNPGEWVAAGAPVVSLLPPGRVKLRFFVPETMVAGLARGQRVGYTCDACPPGASARVSYVAPRAEFTPPVIYSIGSREKLVFLVEAVPEGEVGRLHPGLPVNVAPVP